MRIPKNLERPWLNRDWLYEQYIVQNKTALEIAIEFNCSKFTITTHLLKYNITKDRHRTDKLPYQQYDYLYRMHIVERKTLTEIAKDCGVSSDTIRYNMDRLGIDHWRSKPPIYMPKYVDEIIYKYLVEKKSAYQLGKEYNCTDSSIRTILLGNGIKLRNQSDAQFAYNNKEADKRLFDQQWLYQKHWIENISAKDIGKILGVDPGTVRKHMRSLGIHPKNDSESKIGLMTGAMHPNWKGGISGLLPLLREFTVIHLNPIVLKRDNYICQLCGSKKSLHVHHIIPFGKIISEIIMENPDLDLHDDHVILYNKITSDDRFLDTNNMITYCKFCHWFRIHGYRSRSISSQASSNEEEGSTTIESIAHEEIHG